MKTLATILLISIFLTACSFNGFKEKSAEMTNLKSPKPTIIEVKSPQAPVFVRSRNARDKVLDKIVTKNQQNVTLIDAISLVAPEMSVVAKDSDVKLEKRISIRAINQRFEDYLKQLSNLSEYHITTNGKVVFIASKINKVWDLSTLSTPQPVSDESVSTIQQTEEGGVLTAVSTQSDWQITVAQIKEILGEDAIVTNNEKLGTIYALASVNKINLADEWVRELSEGSTKKIHFKISMIETSTEVADANGVDFSLLLKGSNGTVGIGNVATEAITNAGDISIGTLLKTPLILGDVNLEFLLNILKKQGKAKITNTPNILLTNGTSATLTTGSEFDYISSVESSTDQNGNIVTTPVVGTKNIGLEIKLTAKISKDNKRVTVNVLPVLTSIKSSNTVITGSGQTEQEVVLLDIALTKLATQVVIKPSESVLIGGLYADNITEAVKGVDNGFLNTVFGSSSSANSKKEMLIFITASDVML